MWLTRDNVPERVLVETPVTALSIIALVRIPVDLASLTGGPAEIEAINMTP